MALTTRQKLRNRANKLINYLRKLPIDTPEHSTAIRDAVSITSFLRKSLYLLEHHYDDGMVEYALIASNDTPPKQTLAELAALVGFDFEPCCPVDEYGNEANCNILHTCPYIELVNIQEELV